MIEIIDVTLRDGGHAVDFNWPIYFARNYYNTLSKFSQIKTIELGYWGQTSKSKNMFYNLDYDKVCSVSTNQGLNNISVMVDYHYCSHNVKDYPDKNQSEICMIRLCSRKEDIPNALEFGKELKEYSNINVSFNIFNASNYDEEEVADVCDTIKQFQFDYVYFADTHGNLNLAHDLDRFQNGFNILRDNGIKVGFHLHDHKGLALANYRDLTKREIHSTDTSVRGMGKGSGNLKLEHVINNKEDLTDLARLILDNEKLLTIQPLVYELITSFYGVTDNYAKKAMQLNMPIHTFDKICSNITGLDKDNFNIKVMHG